MELRTDSSHNMINLGGLDLSKARQLNVKLSSLELNIAVFSGCKKLQSNEINSMFDKETIIDSQIVR